MRSARPTAPWRRLVALDVDAGAGKIGPEQVGVPALVAGLFRPIVQASVADQLVEYFGGASAGKRSVEEHRAVIAALANGDA